jgi:hypothetical protein
MIRFTRSAAVAGVLLATVARAGTITQTVNYDFPFEETPLLTFNGFDDQGGTLQLDRVTFDWDLNYEVNYRLENTGPTPLNAGDFYLAQEYYNVHQLGVGDGHPAYGPGATFFAIDNVGLGAYDPAPGGDDVYQGSFTDGYLRTLEFTPGDAPDILQAMTQANPIDTVYGGFGGLMFWWINDPGWDQPAGPEPVYPSDAALWYFLEYTRHFGSVTLTYDYSPVPEPALTAVLAAAFLAIRRRSPARG